ncbi:MAG: hypothetical protein OEZ01_02050 [Candidatus Heimdallarchaeota archaeon]|nr:hypothetical protein [Candidatus Heimdallarchaeota archaeon]MDH5644757.1 hypothetical protein [Candidatus Heimdallarchaeota archaeon]
MSNNCQYCGNNSIKDANFCSSCGNSIKGTKGIISGTMKRIKHQTNQFKDNFKTNLAQKIADYQYRLETDEIVHIGKISIPENKRQTIQNALLKFQVKLGNNEVELSDEFHQWLEDLPNRLEEEKCIICFQQLNKTDKIKVCKHCQSGGHSDHITGWIINNRFCPLCRSEISSTDLIEISF